MLDTVLFDLDGTLTNPKEGITKCVSYAIEAIGRTPPSLKELEVFIGPPLKKQFEEFLDVDSDTGEFLLKKYRERFSIVGIFENEIYEGIRELLYSLKEKGFKIALATSKPTIYADKILKHFDIYKYFDLTIGSELDGTRVEKEEVIEEVLSSLNPDLSKTVMVGDRKFDIIAAKAKGINSIGVKYGFAKENELENTKPDFIVETVEELYEIIRNYGIN